MSVAASRKSRPNTAVLENVAVSQVRVVKKQNLATLVIKVSHGDSKLPITGGGADSSR
jgi:hypothetical protein